MRSSLLVAGGAVGGPLAAARPVHAFGGDLIRIGLVGCGSRGTNAALNALATSGGELRLAAMADVFVDRLQSAFRALKSRRGASFDVTGERRFVGLDAFRQLLETDVDLVILAAPPGFRPLHLEAAVRAGKHVFLPPPVAVDAPGVRRVLAAGSEAQRRGLTVAVGFQRRYDQSYRETIARLRAGAIGDIRLMRAYGTGSGLTPSRRGAGSTELVHQLRNASCFPWLRGGPLVDQHVHNLDVINWLKNARPISAQGQGSDLGQSRPTSALQSYQSCVEFTYADGSKLWSQCRRMPGCWNRVSEHAHGTAGWADLSGGKIYGRDGALMWRSDARRNAAQEQWNGVFAALRSGRLLNELDDAAPSTLTAILGREAAAAGQIVSWDEAFQSDTALAVVDDLHALDQPVPRG